MTRELRWKVPPRHRDQKVVSGRLDVAAERRANLRYLRRGNLRYLRLSRHRARRRREDLPDSVRLDPRPLLANLNARERQDRLRRGGLLLVGRRAAREASYHNPHAIYACKP